MFHSFPAKARGGAVKIAHRQKRKKADTFPSLYGLREEGEENRPGEKKRKERRKSKEGGREGGRAGLV